MKINIRNRFLIVLITLIIISLFIISSYLTKTYDAQLKHLLSGYYYVGIIVYLFLGVIDAVGVPITNIPLIPFIVDVYGFYLGVALTVIGWFIGSIFAFLIARKYGRPFVEKIIPLKKIEYMEKYIPERGFFFSMLFSRISLPHDFVNYGYGIFTLIDLKTFLASSLVGITISALVFAYLDVLPLVYEILIIILGILIFVIFIYFYSRHRKK